MLPAEVYPERGELMVTEEARQYLDTPGFIGGEGAAFLRAFYRNGMDDFDEYRDLSDFGTYCFLGRFDAVAKVYDTYKPNLQKTETPFDFGFISLAIHGSNTWRFRREDTSFWPHIYTLSFLIRNGAPVCQADIFGRSPLHHLGMHHDTSMDGRIAKIAELLMLAGADPNQRDRFGATPLYDAIQDNKMEYMMMALDRGGDLDIPDQDGFSPMSLVHLAGPTMHALVTKSQRRRAGIKAPLEERIQCLTCGEQEGKRQCARCRVARYCNRRCQAADWKAGHQTSCVPFGHFTTTVMCKPIFGTSKGLVIDSISVGDRIRVGQWDKYASLGIPFREEDGPGKIMWRLRLPPLDCWFVGRTMIVKVQIPWNKDDQEGFPAMLDGLPVDSLNRRAARAFGLLNPQTRQACLDARPPMTFGLPREMLVYNRSKEFVCKIAPNGQTGVYDHIESVIKEKGFIDGGKAYFVAELQSEYRLLIKTAEVLAEQPW